MLEMLSHNGGWWKGTRPLPNQVSYLKVWNVLSGNDITVNNSLATNNEIFRNKKHNGMEQWLYSESFYGWYQCLLPNN